MLLRFTYSLGTSNTTCFMMRRLYKDTDCFVQINPIDCLFRTGLLPAEGNSFGDHNQNNITMTSNNFTTTIVVDQTPQEVFDAINNVRGWWSEEIEGDTAKLNAEFNYHYQDVHRSKMKIIESVPGKKVVWQVLDNFFQFTKDKREWTGDTIVFEISTINNKTQLQFTQVG